MYFVVDTENYLVVYRVLVHTLQYRYHVLRLRIEECPRAWTRG